MNTSAYQTIRQAILEKKCMEATYKGFLRLMCPHTLGANKGGVKNKRFFTSMEGKARKVLPKPEVLRTGDVFGLQN